MIPLAAVLTWNAPTLLQGPPPMPVAAVRMFDTDLPGLNPLTDETPIDRRWQDLVFDRLFTSSRPPLASAIVARAEIGPEAVTVQLRPGLKFHDGTDLGPDDVCATVAYHRADANPSGFGACDVLSDTSARIHFASPVSDPVARVALAVLPSGLAPGDLRSDGAFAKNPVGTGPMKAARATGSVRFEAVVSHRAASFASIELRTSGDPQSDLRLLTTGGVDVVLGLPPAVHAGARAAGCTLVSWARTGGPALAVVSRKGITAPKRTANAPFVDAGGWRISP